LRDDFVSSVKEPPLISAQNKGIVDEAVSARKTWQTRQITELHFQMESNQIVPSLHSFMQICNALGAPFTPEKKSKRQNGSSERKHFLSLYKDSSASFVL
jgi:hypothetical protein